jgi:DNA-binding CsgD family transcriptional regulator
MNAGRFIEARSMAETYLDQIAGSTRFDDLELGSIGDAHFALGWAYAMLGQPNVAQEHFARAHMAHRSTGHYFIVAAETGIELAFVALPYQTTDLAERRRLKAEVEANWERVGGAYLELASKPATVDRLPHVWHLMDLLLLEGNWLDERELDCFDSFDKIWRSVFLASLGAMARHQGNTDLAGALVREILPEGPATEPGGTLFRPAVGLQCVAAELALDAGDADLARAWIEAHDRWLAWSGSVLGRSEAQLLWARYFRSTQDALSAREHAVAALARADDPPQPLARLAAHRLLGELATEAGRLAEAEQHLGEASALADACGAPFERALTLLARAELCILSGAAGEAREMLEQVRAICTPLGAAPALARAAALEATCGNAQAPVAGQRAGLSAREVEVLRLVADGLTDAEVASHLWISPRTVGQHLRSIYNKLGVSSRTAATRIAVERHLI